MGASRLCAAQRDARATLATRCSSIVAFVYSAVAASSWSRLSGIGIDTDRRPVRHPAGNKPEQSGYPAPRKTANLTFATTWICSSLLSLQDDRLVFQIGRGEDDPGCHSASSTAARFSDEYA